MTQTELEAIINNRLDDTEVKACCAFAEALLSGESDAGAWNRANAVLTAEGRKPVPYHGREAND